MQTVRKYLVRFNKTKKVRAGARSWMVGNTPSATNLFISTGSNPGGKMNAYEEGVMFNDARPALIGSLMKLNTRDAISMTL